MEKLKMSFTVGYGYGKQIKSKPIPITESMKYLDKVCKEKFDRDVVAFVVPEPKRVKRHVTTRRKKRVE